MTTRIRYYKQITNRDYSRVHTPLWENYWYLRMHLPDVKLPERTPKTQLVFDQGLLRVIYI